MKKENKRNHYGIETLYKNGQKINIINPTILFCDEAHVIEFIKARQFCSNAMGGVIGFSYERYEGTNPATLFGNQQVEDATFEEQAKGKAYEEIF